MNRMNVDRVAVPSDEMAGVDASPEARAYPPGVYPLSFAQQRLWVMMQLGANAAYNVTDALRFRGPLDDRVLEYALGEVVRRHEPLRTRIEMRDGEPVQVVLPARPVRLRAEDVDADEGEAREAEYSRRVEEESAREFSPEGPFLRARLLRADDEDHVLCWTVHHVMTDGWSQGVFRDELLTLYAAFAADQGSPLEELPTTFGEYALRQRRELGGEALEALAAWWRERMAGLPELLELPTDRPRPAEPSGEGESLTFQLAEGRGRRVEELARERGATPFMVLLAAFQAVLGRWSGQEDVVVGTPIANRTRPEVEGLVGFFANTLALRLDLSGDPTFAELIDRAREMTLGAYEHQDLPFEKLVEELRSERSTSHSPVYQVMLVLQNAPSGTAGGGEIEGIEVSGVARGRLNAQNDLTFSLYEWEGGFFGMAEYAAELFDRATIARMAEQLDALLSAGLDAPETPLSLLPPLTEAGLAAERALSASPAPDPDARGTVLDRIAARAAEAPGATAVVAEDGSLTFGEMEARAASLAAFLRARGAGPESRVAIAMDRGIDLAVAMLGVMKAGAAYVPVDLAYPAERIEWMLADSGAALVLTHSSSISRLPETGALVVAVDTEWERIAAADGDLPAVEIDPASAAYVIYTSGSTGRPKGVVIPHAALANLVDGHAAAAELRPGDRLLQVASVSFDISVEEIFPTWGAGAAVVFRPAELPDGAGFSRLLEEREITVIDPPTALWHEWMRALEEGAPFPPSLRLCVIGGERAREDAVAAWARVSGGARLWNSYGPTEITVTATTHRVEADADPRASVPIGRPVAGARAYVLDTRMRPLPAGIPGELFVGGAGVARGYLGRPGLTAERFLPDAVSGVPGARVYRTGDRVRRRVGGELEFLGRVDEQVKVRGFRVEPGEIESVLRAFPGVRDAVVVARGDGAAKRLAAYVTPAGVDTGALREHAAARLPEYMVPSAFAVLDALPMTPGGKVDRRALPEPEFGAGAGWVAPRTLTEEMVAGIWAELLGVERVGAEDGFFDLGGHSLLATRLVTRVREAFGVEVPMRVVFRNATLARFAARVDAALRAGDASAAEPPLVPAGGRSGLPLSYGQERIWGMDRLNPGALAFNVSTALHFPPDAAPALQRALTEVVRRHQVLRAVFREGEAGPVMEILPPAPVPLPVDDLVALSAGEAGAAVEAATAAAGAETFDLERGPLLRARLLRGARGSLLIVSIHHVVFDGWSTGVLERELRALHDAFSRGEPSPLPPLPVQYADWAAWQRRRWEEGGLDAQVEYWRQALAGAPEVLELPADRPLPAVPTHAGARRFFHLPESVIAPARALARREGATLFMVLMAAYDVLLSRLSGSEDVVVGTQVAGRTRAETEGLVGFFVNNLALRTDLSGDPSFRELVVRVRRAALDAYAHQDLPFQKLVDALGVERTMAYSPIFQASFVFQPAEDAAEAAAAARAGDPVLPAAPLSRPAQYELTFDLHEAGAGVIGVAAYSTERFDHATAERFVDAYRLLLESFVADPEAAISAPPAMDEAERRRVVETWNDTAAAFPPHPSVHAMIARRAAETPAAVAAVFEEREMPYAELDARAGRLAALLRGLGVGPESRVAVAMERGMEIPVAVLGALKAGAAYVPVDPAYPAERIEWMTADSAAAVILTQARVIDRLPSTGASVVAVDEAWERLGSMDAESLSAEVHPLNAAYVIYTSGSTGRPKGVVVPHATLLNHNRAIVEAYGLRADDRVLQFASLSFDKSVEDIFPTWTVGAALVLRPAELAGGADFSRWLEARRITVANPPTAFWNEWVRDLAETGGAVPSSLRVSLFGGETVRPDAVAQWRRMAPRVPMINGYGPTEITVTATVHALRPGADPRADVPIGRPIANVRVYVLDAAMRPVPTGVPGELYVGGAGVARGYLNRPALTAERFIPDPFSAEPGARLYRTGDRARWRGDGEVDFLGRMDHQVKIRGFRIEPGEIEIALREHGAVRDAVVIAREDGGRSARLVAYVAPMDGASVDSAALRAHLADRLPSYMIPSAFVAIERVPLTPGGKVDRRALPAPVVEQARSDAALPSSPAEEVLARIWAGVLRVDEIGVHDNFFALGGDSILAIQVVSRAAREGYRITPRDLFQHQTVAELARAAGAVEAAAAPAEPRGPVTGPAPLTPIQHWFFDRFGGEAHWNMAMMVSVAAPVDAAVLEHALAAVSEHHDVLRLRFAFRDGEWRQAFAEVGETVPVEVADLTSLTGGELSAAIEAHAVETHGRLELERGPISRVVVYRGGAGEADRLFWVIHHLAVDAVSWGILLEDLVSAYAQASAGSAVVLPPRTTSFARWAEGLAAWAATDEARGEAEWWLSQPWDRAAPLPAGNAVDGDREGDAESLSAELDEETTRALLQEVPPVYGTQVNDALLAALARALSGWTGGRAVAVELEGHGREEMGGMNLTRSVGWFTTAFPVLLHAAADEGALLRETKERLRALPRRGLSFGAARWLSRDEEMRGRLAAIPSPEVSFNYLGQGGAGGGDGWLRGAAESPGPQFSPRAPRATPVSVLASVAGSRLRVRWSWPARRFAAAEVERVAAAYLDALRALVAHARASAGGYTPSDFPLARVDQPALDRALAEVGAGARGSVEDVYPLTPLQEGMLFHALEGDGAGVYHAGSRFAMRGELDEEALARAWAALVERTPVLRTAFAWRGLERPLQVVLRDTDFAVERLDWRGESAEEIEARLAAHAREDRERGFRPDRAPLLRVALVRTAEDEREMLWSFHHLVLDGWSFPRMMEDLAELHRAFSQGDAPKLRDRPRFRDHLALIAGRDPAVLEAFWRAELAGYPGAEPNPLARPAAPGHVPAVFREARTTLGRAASERLRERAARAGLTVTTLFQGALALLLSRYTGADDVAFGNVVSGRSAELEGGEEIVGMLINTLPVRARVPSDLSASDWLRHLQARQAEARQHDHAPLVEVREWAGVEPGRELLDTLFVYENYPVPQAPAGSADAPAETETEAVLLDVEPMERTNYPLAFAVAPVAEGTRVKLTYDAERFDAAAARRLLGHYLALIDALSAAGDAPLATIPMLSADEERALLSASVGAAAPTETAPLHRLFEAWVKRAPEAPALSFRGESISYAELNARANRLARRLVARGVGAESVVAISLERSPEIVVALLAVNKAGGAFLPVDPAYPAERRRWMLEDSGARIVITHSSLAADLPTTNAVVIAVDGMATEIDREEDADLSIEVDPENAAYVIFTSGSTGRPKGVVVPHRGIGNLAARFAELFGVGAGSRMLQFASFSFDATVGEVAVALLNGATLVVAEAERIAGPGLLALLRDEEVTATLLPPSLLAALPDAELPALRTLIAGGEAVSPEVARRWGAGRRFLNAYGPTEITVAASVSVDPAPADGRVPIGPPMPNVRAYVLDPAMRPVPIGVPGELYVGGVQLARGYLDRPGLTAERFVPDAVSGEPGARLYRTGDRVRRLESGETEFLGRVDQQLKVRGFRVETGEVESVLLEHPAVREAVVLARGEGDSRRLVAYAAASADARPTAAELKAHLASTLPEHMVPSAIVILDAFPLTPNGKIDRRALPDPDLGADEDRAAPRTPTEEILAGIWSELLRVGSVGVDDGFFALGGHSLLATRMVSRVRETLGVELPIRAVFEDATLAALAARVDASLRAGDGVPLPPLAPRGHDGDAPLSFTQERLWILQRLSPESPAYTVPSTFRFGGALDAGVLERALAEIVRRHHALRTVIAQTPDGPVQRVVEVDFHLPVRDVTDLPPGAREAEAARIVAEDLAAPFEMEGGALFRILLVRIAPDDHVLHLSAHHVVYDGWSAGVFVRELTALYDAFLDGRPSPLPDLPVQYADYAEWQRGWMTDEAVARQVGYWTERLAGAPPLLELPTRRPRPAVQGYAGGVVGGALPPELLAGVRALARREGATPFMVLLAALDVVLSRWSGQDDVVVGTQVAGRTHAGTEPLLGVFLNTLVLRADLSGAPSFREVLARVREAALGAYAHGDVPFERVLEALRVPRSLGHSPVFQVMVNYQNFGGEGGAPAGLEALPFGAGEAVSKLDLTLYASERADGLGLALVYAAELFDEAAMRELLEQTAAVLQQAVDDAGRPVGEMSLRTPEAAAILPDPSEPLDRTWRGSVPEIFARRAAERPGALAVADPRERWTYAELDASTARIARRLIEGGVRPGDTVTIWAHRSAAMARAMMGVLRAGAAFVALDPVYPPARLAEYVRIASPRGFLRIAAAGAVPAEVEDALSATATVTVELGSKSAEGIDGVDGWGSMSPDALGVEIGPDSLAYLSFTSGTTGAPKAVMGRHGSLTHFTPWLAERFGLTADDRYSMLSGLAHDPLHRDVFTPLQLGASVIAPDPAGVGTPGYLGRWMAEASVTVAHLTPAMGQLLADTSDLADEAEAAGSLPSLRRAFFVGDVLARGDVARLHRLAPHVTVVNYYGSTETQRAVSHHVVDPEQADAAKPIVPLGRGIPGVQLLVRNAGGALAGIGELGEVWLRSPHVALGYRGDAELTAARFVANPWTGDAGDGMYRTGDLGRYTPDGEVEPAGRADQQVKVRGFRIELGEVEAALAKHAAVREAVVMARGEGDAKRLVAWLTSTGERPGSREMRDHLRALLPDFMVPSAFVWLDALPLTPNGKVDRRALPDPGAPAAAAPTAPRNPTEEVIAGIWTEVLGVEDVGVEDDFFVLGGHSLRATQVLSRISRALEVELPLRVLFETPTVAGLAAAVEAAGGGALADALAELEGLSDEEVAALLAEIGEEA